MKYSSQDSGSQRRYLCLLFDFLYIFIPVIYCGRLLGTPSLPWKWQHNMLLLLPLPFMFLLAPSVPTCCLHAVISRKRPELRKMVPSLQDWLSPAPTLSPSLPTPNGTLLSRFFQICLALFSHNISGRNCLRSGWFLRNTRTFVSLSPKVFPLSREGILLPCKTKTFPD